MLSADGKTSTTVAVLVGALAVAACGMGIAYVLAQSGAGMAILIATIAPFVVLLLLARPRFGLYALVFTAPYVDVLKTMSMGVTFRFNEIFGLLLFLIAILHILRGRQRLRFSTLDFFIVGLLVSMVTSIIANLGNLPSEERLKQVPTAWFAVSGELDTPQLATYKKMMQGLVAFAVYFAVNNLVTTWHTWHRAVKTLIISSMLVCVWALFNLLGFIGGMSSGLGMRASNIWFKTGEAPRITGTLSEPSFFANFLVLVIPVAFFAYARKTALLSPRWDLAAVILLCLTLVFTFSGGGWVVFVVELALLLGVCVRHGLPARKLGAMILVLAVVASIALMAAALFTDMNYSRLASDNWQKVVDLFEAGVGSGRRVAPDVGWMMFCDHPFFGVGPGMFATFEYDYLLRLGFVEETPSSTFYARTLGELGALGMMMVLGIFLSATWICLRWARRAPHPPTQTILWGMAVAFVAIAVHYMAHANFWWPYVWVMFGLANSGARLARKLTLEGRTDWES